MALCVPVWGLLSSGQCTRLAMCRGEHSKVGTAVGVEVVDASFTGLRKMTRK